jgi:peptidyl-Asp metalloendopeptidase
MRVASALIVALLLSGLPSAERAAASPAWLFDTPPIVPAESSRAASRSTVRRREVTARLSLLVRPDGSPALGAGERVLLNLFDDARFAMTVTEVTRPRGTSLTWSGSLDGVDLGSAVLALQDGALVGHVRTPDSMYRIGYAGDGTPVVEELDTAAFPPEAPSIVPTPDAGEFDGDTPAVVHDAASQIDVMVLYTAAARAAAGGAAALRAEASLAVALSNQAYANNGLAQRLRLVHVGETSIVETNDFAADLGRVAGDPTVAWLRNATRADLVSLFTANGSSVYCGIAYLLMANTPAYGGYAYSVVERSCAAATLTFPHELGHNMGANHDAFVAGTGPAITPYSHGYVDLVAKFLTIMSYPNQCTTAGLFCSRIPYFSTPGRAIGGRPIGNAATADNARTLAETANTVANFRPSVKEPFAVTTAVNQASVAVGQTLVVSVNVNHPGGLAGTADFYAGLLLPDGSAVFFTDVMLPGRGYERGTITNAGSYRPIATAVPLAGPLVANVPAFFSYPRQPGDPTGGLAFFLLAVKSGPLTSGTFTSDQLLAASFAPFSFPPP